MLVELRSSWLRVYPVNPQQEVIRPVDLLGADRQIAETILTFSSDTYNASLKIRAQQQVNKLRKSLTRLIVLTVF